MPYTKPRDWADGFDGGTPITAADLNRIEDGITATTVKADAAATATALAAVKSTADAAATATALAAVKTTADAAATSTALADVKATADAAATATALAAAVPVGVVQMWAGASAPSGWLLCQGQAVSRTTYAALFAVCGTAYGAGNGSGTFNLPDLRARMPLGLNSTGTFNALGKTGGEENHTLTTAEMASHTHDFAGGVSFSWGTNMGDVHILDTGSAAAGPSTVANSLYTNSGKWDKTAATGGGGAHNNMPPYMVMNFIIRAS